MAKYEKMISLGSDPYTGKRIRTRIRAETKAGLKQAEKEALMKYAKKGRESKITVEQYIWRWFDVYCAKLAINTQESYKTALRKLKPLYDKPMCKVTRLDLQEIVNQNWEHPWQVKKLLGKLDTIWDLATAEGVVDRNVAHKLAAPKAVEKKRRALTAEEKKAVKEANLTPQERLYLDIEYQFGLRPGEAFCLCKTDVNYKQKTLTISKSLTHDHGQPVIKKTKTETVRVLPVPDSFLKRFKEISTFYFFMTDEGNLFTKKECDKFKLGILNKVREALGGDENGERLVMYNFRHGRATEIYYMHSPGLSNKAKAAYMGHSEEMFVSRYSHIQEDRENTELLREEVI